MPPYEKNLIEETAKLTQENNKILRGIQSAARWERFFGAIKWIIIIGLTVGAYYYIQPYLETLLKVYSSVGGPVPNISVLENALKNFSAPGK